MIVGGKTYISSKRAAKMFSYTNDYIGQLSRSHKVDSIMVGRDRFIDYSSLARYIDQKSEISVSTPKAEVSTKNTPTNQSNHNSKFSNYKVALATLTVFTLFLFFGSFPFVDSVSRHAEKERQNILQSASMMESVITLGQSTDTAYLGFLSRIDDRLIALWRNLRQKFLALFVSPDRGTDEKVIQTKTYTTSSPIYVSNQAGLTEEQIRLISKDVVDQEIARTIDYASLGRNRKAGIVVAPSTGSQSGDEALKQSIQNSFSDEVDVELDASRGAGVIRPIFRSPTDDSYIFVVVPVNRQ